MFMVDPFANQIHDWNTPFLSQSFELDFLKSKRFFGTQLFLFLFKIPIIIIIMAGYQKTSGSQEIEFKRLT